jgi:hypothetical protein
MNIQKILALAAVNIFAIAIAILLIRAIAKRIRLDLNIDIKQAGLLFITSILVNVTVVVYTANAVLNEGLDTLFKLKPPSLGWECFKLCSLILGLCVGWFGFWNLVAAFLATLIIGNRKLAYEIENNQIAVVAINGLIVFAFLICSSGLLLEILRNFLPAIPNVLFH